MRNARVSSFVFFAFSLLFVTLAWVSGVRTMILRRIDLFRRVLLFVCLCTCVLCVCMCGCGCVCVWARKIGARVFRVHLSITRGIIARVITSR